MGEAVVKQELKEVTSQEAFSESMMFAYAYKMSRAILVENFKREIGAQHKSIVELLRAETADMCAESSMNAIYFLMSRHPDIFSRFILITGSQNDECRFNHGDWNYHTYFVAVDNSGKIFAGSPANNKDSSNKQDGEGKIVSMINRVFVSDSVDNLLTQIAAFEGGMWPVTDELEAALDQEYKAPQFDYMKQRNLRDDGEDEFVIRIDGKILEASTYRDKYLPAELNTPIHMRTMSGVVDRAASLNLAIDGERAHDENDVSLHLVVDHADDPRWI